MSRPTQGCARFLPVRGCHPLWPAFPDGSGCYARITGLVRFRSPLLTESLLMSFPQATEMFQFAWFASRTYVFSSGSPCGGVSPFGNPRIKACSRLPMAYRSVPRPSSPLGAKASTKCPYLTLDLSIVTPIARPSDRSEVRAKSMTLHSRCASYPDGTTASDPQLGFSTQSKIGQPPAALRS